MSLPSSLAVPPASPDSCSTVPAAPPWSLHMKDALIVFFGLSACSCHAHVPEASRQEVSPGRMCRERLRHGWRSWQSGAHLKISRLGPAALQAKSRKQTRPASFRIKTAFRLSALSARSRSKFIFTWLGYPLDARLFQPHGLFAEPHSAAKPGTSAWSEGQGNLHLQGEKSCQGHEQMCQGP